MLRQYLQQKKNKKNRTPIPKNQRIKKRFGKKDTIKKNPVNIPLVRPGLGALGAAKKDKIKDRQTKLEKEQRLMRKENFFTGAKKTFDKDKETYKKVDPGFKKGKNKDTVLEKVFLQKDSKEHQKVFDEMKASNREAGRTTKSKGGSVKKKKGGAAIRGISKILR